ncbi:MAG TPA: OmpA family protein [Chryseosolibacter sp.]|nr:OmpA family protein [Chryseosolibacter sp.]
MNKLTVIFLLTTLVVKGQIPVVLNETFDKNIFGWYESNEENHKVLVTNGKYFLQAPEGGWMTYVSPFVDPSKDFFFQATFRQLNGLDDNGIGFIWGYDAKDNMNNFTFTTNGYYRIWCADRTINISDEWHETSLVKPMGEENVLRVEQKQRTMYYYLNGKLLTTTVALPWYGKNMGFVAYTKMEVEIDNFIFGHDIRLNILRNTEKAGDKENLGSNVNSEYDEVSPKISADGKTLFFGRKHSPQNMGGTEDREDIWMSRLNADGSWSRSVNLGPPVNTASTNNLLSVSTDDNTLLFHTTSGFGVMHRVTAGWSPMKDLGIYFKNESEYLEGSLSPDGKAILFVAKLKSNLFYRAEVDERDIYVCEKKSNGTWSAPIHTGRVLNTAGDEYSPVLSADGKTLYFATDGRPGYGDVDIFMAKRIGNGWNQWSEPVNLGLGINTVGFDAYYTLPASGEYGYMVSNIKSFGLADIIRFKLPKNMRPEPVMLVSGKVLNAKTQMPLEAVIRFDDLGSGQEVGEARSTPGTGEYRIALPVGKTYGYHAAASGYLSVNENLELIDLTEYNELRKDLYLVPIEVGESIQLKNVFFVQSKPELKPESYPELDRLVDIMRDNPTVEIQLEGHTDNLGRADANLLLSEKRVEAVKEYLVSKGIRSSRITGKGYGGSRPVAPSDTEVNRQLNRRVEFKITKK